MAEGDLLLDTADRLFADAFDDTVMRRAREGNGSARRGSAYQPCSPTSS